MARRILYAFGANGDIRQIPDTDATSTGAVSYSTGYGIDYQKRLDSEAGAKNIDRSGYNGVLNDVTGNTKQWQDQCYPAWYAPTGSPTDQGYPKRAVVRYTDGNVYASKIVNNRDLPTNVASWEFQYTSQELLAFVPEPYRGIATAGGSFRAAPYATTNGVWDFPTDALVLGFGFTPQGALAGYLQTKVSTGAAVQTYTDSTGNQWTQGLNTGTNVWTSWKKSADTSTVFLTGPRQIEAADATTNWDSLTVAGSINILGLLGPNAPPVALKTTPGNLLISSNVGGAIMQTFTYATPAPITTGAYSRVFTGSTWTAWNFGASDKVPFSGGAMKGALALFAGSTSPTPAQFDNTIKVATMEAIRRAGFQYAATEAILTSRALTAADAGKFLVAAASGLTVTLPKANTVPGGTTFNLFTYTAGNMPIVVTAAGDIIAGGSLSVSTFVQKSTGGISLTSEGPGFSTWAVSGTGANNQTSAFIDLQNSVGSYKGLKGITTGDTISVADTGKVMVVNATMGLTIPLASSVPAGSTFTFFVYVKAYTPTFVRSGADVFAGGTGTMTSYVGKNTGYITFVAETSGVWDITGTGALDLVSGLQSSVSTNGYQRFPGGLIFQWGTTGASLAAGTAMTISLPIAYPTYINSAVACGGMSLDTTTGSPVAINFLSSSQFIIRNIGSSFLADISWQSTGR